ncbi:RND transporter [Sporosarcina jeotgali]|uniref:RND transporter n=1 Tax=Sporosarcina jeotgali TaxID=3020056 RepID=A0ABZ0KZ67_9BACL|nr:RND transporter [Sporosarcina sp. B2O-1]WOV85674.1 RND transporter [Sporosarcina sp. B2O-1]
MKSNNDFIRSSWVIYFGLLAAGIITACFTFYELSIPETQDLGDEGQSRIQFRWGSFHMYWSIAILALSGLLAAAYKHVKPFHVVVIIILTGAANLLFFMTFTVGWVAAQGMLGFAVAIAAGMILFFSKLIFIWISHLKRIKG